MLDVWNFAVGGGLSLRVTGPVSWTECLRHSNSGARGQGNPGRPVTASSVLYEPWCCLSYRGCDGQSIIVRKRCRDSGLAQGAGGRKEERRPNATNTHVVNTCQTVMRTDLVIHFYLKYVLSVQVYEFLAANFAQTITLKVVVGFLIGLHSPEPWVSRSKFGIPQLPIILPAQVALQGCHCSLQVT